MSASRSSLFPLFLKVKLYILGLQVAGIVALGLVAAGFLSVAVVVGMVLMGLDFATSDVFRATVTGHQWERNLYLQERVREVGEGWCADRPRDATVRKRETRTRQADRSAGRRSDSREEWCTWERLDWLPRAPLVRKGTDTHPRWPEFRATNCAEEGCTREDRRTETLTLRFQVGRADTGHCVVKDEVGWRRLDRGDRMRVRQGGILKDFTCLDL